MVTVPAGEFMMGTSAPGPHGVFGGTATAVPEHPVTLDSFEMGSTEVTNAQYAGYLNAALEESKIELRQRDRCIARITITIPCWEVIGAEGETYAGEPYITLSPYQGLSVVRVPEPLLNRSWIIYSPYMSI